jgi:predicted O-linked N-acetylglucosamine transferase (SPINDLY family)
LRRFDDASVAADKALGLEPGLPEAWVVRGNVSAALKQYDRALDAYDKAISLDAGSPHGWLGRGYALSELQRYEDAVKAYDQALLLDINFPKALLGRGQVLRALARYDEALMDIDRAIALDPQYIHAWLYRGINLMELNRPKEAAVAFDEALKIKPDFLEAIADRIFVFDFISEFGFAEQQQARALWWERVGAPLAEQSKKRHTNTRDPDRRLKIGYVSADFCIHSASRCFGPVLFSHDKDNFEIICYSSTHPPDERTTLFKEVADRWHDVSRVSDEGLAARIRDDQIDILVDLSGHSAGTRLGVFARKPAPIQVTAWGHATGTGLQTIDYMFSDPVACPATVRHLFAEKIVDLPCFITVEPLPDGLKDVEPPLLSKGLVTFGIFNRVSRLSDEAISVWAQILHAVPKSRILMKDGRLAVPAVRDSIVDKFKIRDIADDRLAFLGRTSRSDHLATFGEVDIALDPFPNSGGITAWESLQMGVPVVARLGNGIGNRTAGAILSSVGMSDWVAKNDDEYVAIATKFAGMPEQLKTLRHELPSRIAQSDAGNSLKYTRAVETAYRKMWIEYCREIGA